MARTPATMVRALPPQYALQLETAELCTDCGVMPT